MGRSLLRELDRDTDEIPVKGLLARLTTLLIALITIVAAMSCQGPETSSKPTTEDTKVSEAASGFVFTAAGDYGSSKVTTATLDLIARSGANFNLALGDLSYTDASESVWCDYVRSRVGDSFPFQLVAGNHEGDFGGDGHNSEFAACLPDRMDSVGDYPEEYYFDYRGLARFIVISPDLTIEGKHYIYGDANEHYEWVAKAIDDARAADIPWVIVGMHKNCRSVGEYYCNIYQELMSLLVEKKVDLVLQAHDHTYQRTRQLDTGPTCAIVKVDSFDDDCVVDSGFCHSGGRRSRSLPHKPERPRGRILRQVDGQEQRPEKRVHEVHGFQKRDLGRIRGVDLDLRFHGQVPHKGTLAFQRRLTLLPISLFVCNGSFMGDHSARQAWNGLRQLAWTKT
jgi:hypothetical protein